MKHLGKKGLIAIILIAVFISLGASSTLIALAANDWSFSNNEELLATETDAGVEVLDYTATKQDITGGKLILEDLELEDKMWFEYVSYSPTPYATELIQADESGNTQYTCDIYIPDKNEEALIMAVRDYQPDGVDQNTTVKITWYDMVPLVLLVASGNAGVILSGGYISGAYGLMAEGVISESVFGTMQKADDLIDASKYYSDPSFMGIKGDPKWNGISNDGFYNLSSLSVSMTQSSLFSVSKTNTVSSKMSIGGEFKTNTEVDAFFASEKIEFASKLSSDFSYGINFQQSQQIQQSQAVSHTFNARTDELVKNVPWKLCEYVVQMPLHAKIYDRDGNLLYDQYIMYNYLQGVSRVFANGYIEHWNTGELVSYADFFEGMLTAQQVIDQAKEAKEKK